MQVLFPKHYDYIRNTCLHQIDERELVTYLSVLQLLHDESHPSHSSITDPLPTSLLLLVLSTLLCLGLSLATRGIGPLCCCHYCCFFAAATAVTCYFAAAATTVPCYSAVTCCKTLLALTSRQQGFFQRRCQGLSKLCVVSLLSYYLATNTLLADTNLSGVVELTTQLLILENILQLPLVSESINLG